MGKIKSKTIKNSAANLISEGVEFTENFEENKKILKNTMPSKKIRNQMAGYLVRLKKQQRLEKPKIDIE
ncbi:MAG: 30S ribosomal protein S17e [Candidatus Pacearchaeota archaeon]|jgi:ribosomal protein S17E